MNQYSIESANENNRHELAHLFLQLWPEGSLEEELENTKELINNEKQMAYLIHCQENYIAFIHLTLRQDYIEGAEDLPVAYIEGIYVNEKFRHLGLGSKLIHKAEKWAKEKGCSQLASDTELSNATGISFHEQNGLTETNRIVCFIKDV